jgi:hypothetical protein
LNAVLGIGVGLIIYSLVPFWALFGMGIIMLILVIKIKRSLKSLNENGFINRKSDKLRDILLERSLYDLFADLWYFPVITLYLKALLSPFLT